MRKKHVIPYVIHFLICEMIFALLFSIIYIYHGPFTKLRDYIVSTSMNTYDYKFISTMFLSKNEINSILKRTDPAVGNATENVSDVKIAPTPGIKTSISKNDANKNDGVTIKDLNGKNYKGKLMIINDPSRVTVGITPKLGGIGATLSSIVKYYNAEGGINAGGFRDIIGGVPAGIVIDNGKITYKQSGLNTFDIIGFTYDNILMVNNSMTLSKIKSSNLRCAISFGPALIINGQPLVKKGGTALQPRSAIAQKKDGTVLFLAIDGRQSSSAGVNLKVLQDILLQYGAYNAANLDGGSSTTLYYKGKVINSPNIVTGERYIASAFLVMPNNV